MLDLLKEGLLRLDPGLFLWTVISFAIVMIILWLTAWKPLLKALDERNARIRKDLDDAEEARKQAEELLKRHKEIMEQAREDALKLVAREKSGAEAIRDEIIEKANSESKAILDRANREIVLAKEKALQEIRGEIVHITTEIASRVIERNLNEADQKSIIESALEEIKA